MVQDLTNLAAVFVVDRLSRSGVVLDDGQQEGGQRGSARDGANRTGSPGRGWRTRRKAPSAAHARPSPGVRALRLVGPAFRTKAAEDDVMLANRYAGLGFKCGRLCSARSRKAPGQAHRRQCNASGRDATQPTRSVPVHHRAALSRRRLPSPASRPRERSKRNPGAPLFDETRPVAFQGSRRGVRLLSSARELPGKFVLFGPFRQSMLTSSVYASYLHMLLAKGSRAG